MERRQSVKTLGLTIGMLLGVNPLKALGEENDLIEQQLKFFREELTKSQLVDFILLVLDLMNEALADLSELKEEEIANVDFFEIMKTEIFDQEISVETCELLMDGLKNYDIAIKNLKNEEPTISTLDRVVQIESTEGDGQFAAAIKLIHYLRDDLVKRIGENVRKELKIGKNKT
ncbi:MAG: hypothetical protein MI974_07445 [Chitinophagales bacterium]|nr:hypothetical protein [Chitinophagales bacterium]